MKDAMLVFLHDNTYTLYPPFICSCDTLPLHETVDTKDPLLLQYRHCLMDYNLELYWIRLKRHWWHYHEMTETLNPMLMIHLCWLVKRYPCCFLLIIESFSVSF